MTRLGLEPRTPTLKVFALPTELSSRDSFESENMFCDPIRIRTWDLLLRRQLLYPAELLDLTQTINVWFVGVAGFEPATSCSQSRRDNRATLHPESVILKKAERQGLEPWHRLPDDRLAICSVTTPAPLLKSILKERFFVIQSGFEPETYCLEGSCSIQLSYWT